MSLKKKTICFIAIFVFTAMIPIVLLCSCTIANDTNNTNDDSKYDIVIDQYRNAITKFNSEQKDKTT